MEVTIDFLCDYPDNKLIRQFEKQFKADFHGMLPGVTLYVSPRKGTSMYSIHVEETAFWEIITESLKTKKNLFIIPENEIPYNPDILY